MPDDCITCHTPIYWGQPNTTIYRHNKEPEHMHGRDSDCKYKRMDKVMIRVCWKREIDRTGFNPRHGDKI
jgi:hypothetical protein